MEYEVTITYKDKRKTKWKTTLENVKILLEDNEVEKLIIKRVEE